MIYLGTKVTNSLYLKQCSTEHGEEKIRKITENN